jgi:hypothetical protein
VREALVEEVTLVERARVEMEVGSMRKKSHDPASEPGDFTAAAVDVKSTTRERRSRRVDERRSAPGSAA